jgi:hypothetical protein
LIPSHFPSLVFLYFFWILWWWITILPECKG